MSEQTTVMNENQVQILSVLAPFYDERAYTYEELSDFSAVSPKETKVAVNSLKKGGLIKLQTIFDEETRKLRGKGFGITSRGLYALKTNQLKNKKGRP